jgi:S-adenosylmethionine:tRNA ribosyltransferase-isomerase
MPDVVPTQHARCIDWTISIPASPITFMRTDDLDFHLPPELIAQAPAPDRAASRLLHYRKSNHSLEHRTFSDLPQLLRRGDLLVFNDAKVVPARFLLRKNTGGGIEGLYLSEPSPGEWSVLLRNLGKAPVGTVLHFAEAPEITATVLVKGMAGEYRLAVSAQEPALVVLNRVGRMPLPPYIKREKEHDARDEADRQRYQTVYARSPGSVAAPTAGLHFTEPILRELDSLGVERICLTLHVGLGTFKPVTAEALAEHAMHTEAYEVNEPAAAALNRAESEGRRIVAVGTTSARVLESWPAGQPWHATTGETSIFIYPPYGWKRVGALVTNFHLPRSTLIALVAAFVGLDEQRRIYQTAIEQRYRFFSYGDAMFLE